MKKLNMVIGNTDFSKAHSIASQDVSLVIGTVCTLIEQVHASEHSGFVLQLRDSVLDSQGFNQFFHGLNMLGYHAELRRGDNLIKISAPMMSYDFSELLSHKMDCYENERSSHIFSIV